MPYNLLLILLAVVSFSSRARWIKTLSGLALLGFYTQANPWIVNKALLFWEEKPRSIQSIPKNYDYGILLTGGLTSYRESVLDFPQLADNSDRLLATYYLYKRGKIRKILITGTDHKELIASGLSEGRESRRLLKEWGIPEENIILEERARNTRENALYTAEMLPNHTNSDLLLITSAFHMKRAKACFEKVNLKVDTFPADVKSTTNSFSLKRGIVPEPKAVGDFSLVWREWVGFLIYKVMGYC